MHVNSVCFKLFYYIPYKMHKKGRFRMFYGCAMKLAMAGPPQGHRPLTKTLGTLRESRTGQILLA